MFHEEHIVITSLYRHSSYSGSWYLDDGQRPACPPKLPAQAETGLEWTTGRSWARAGRRLWGGGLDAIIARVRVD